MGYGDRICLRHHHFDVHGAAHRRFLVGAQLADVLAAGVEEAVTRDVVERDRRDGRRAAVGAPTSARRPPTEAGREHEPALAAPQTDTRGFIASPFPERRSSGPPMGCANGCLDGSEGGRVHGRTGDWSEAKAAASRLSPHVEMEADRGRFAILQCGPLGRPERLGVRSSPAGDYCDSQPRLPLSLLSVGIDRPVQSPAATGSWSEKARLGEQRTEAAVVAANGRIYVLGGMARGQDSHALNQEYDPAADRWRERAPMPRPAQPSRRRRAQRQDLRRRRLPAERPPRCAGPPSRVRHRRRIRWRTLAPIKSPRGSVGVVALNGKIHAIGGRDVNRVTVAVHEVYDPATGTWSALAPLPRARDHVAVDRRQRTDPRDRRTLRHAGREHRHARRLRSGDEQRGRRRRRCRRRAAAARPCSTAA